MRKHPQPYVQRHTCNYALVFIIPSSPRCPSRSAALLFPLVQMFFHTVTITLLHPLYQNNMTGNVMDVMEINHFWLETVSHTVQRGTRQH